MIKDKYNLELSEDICDAIGIGIWSKDKIKFKNELNIQQ